MLYPRPFPSRKSRLYFDLLGGLETCLLTWFLVQQLLSLCVHTTTSQDGGARFWVHSGIDMWDPWLPDTLLTSDMTQLPAVPIPPRVALSTRFQAMIQNRPVMMTLERLSPCQASFKPLSEPFALYICSIRSKREKMG